LNLKKKTFSDFNLRAYLWRDHLTINDNYIISDIADQKQWQWKGEVLIEKTFFDKQSLNDQWKIQEKGFRISQDIKDYRYRCAVACEQDNSLILWYSYIL